MKVWNDKDTLLDGIKLIKEKMKEIPISNFIESEFKSRATGLHLGMDRIKTFNEYVENAIEEMKQDYKKSLNLIEDWRESAEDYLIDKLGEKEK